MSKNKKKNIKIKSHTEKSRKSYTPIAEEPTETAFQPFEDAAETSETPDTVAETVTEAVEKTASEAAHETVEAITTEAVAAAPEFPELEEFVSVASVTEEVPAEATKRTGMSFFVTAVVALVAMVVTFMVTFISMTDIIKNIRYEDNKKYNEELAKLEEEIEYLMDSKNIENLFFGYQVTDEQRKFMLQRIFEIDSMFALHEFNEMDYEAITDYVLHAYVAAVGDKYAEYYNEEAFEAMIESMKGQNQGIGVNIAYDSEKNAIGIINVMPSSPAEKAGVLPGDTIIAVGKGDKKELVAEIGYTAAVIKLQGEKGTVCEFTVERNEKQIEFSIKRDEYENQSVLWHEYAPDKTVAVVRIMSFDGKTFEQFKAVMEEIESKGIKNVVFDVRSNPGGTLDSIVSILDYLLPEGTIIRITDKTGNIVETRESDKNAHHTDMKFAVLANENTASAAELFTSALMDYNRATIVGTKTYGKGSMQTTFYLGTDRGLKLTTRHYLPPYSESYDGIGIVPHINVEVAPELADKNIFMFTDEEDNQLGAAVNALK